MNRGTSQLLPRWSFKSFIVQNHFELVFLKFGDFGDFGDFGFDDPEDPDDLDE